MGISNVYRNSYPYVASLYALKNWELAKDAQMCLPSFLLWLNNWHWQQNLYNIWNKKKHQGNLIHVYLIFLKTSTWGTTSNKNLSSKNQLQALIQLGLMSDSEH